MLHIPPLHSTTIGSSCGTHLPSEQSFNSTAAVTISPTVVIVLLAVISGIILYFYFYFKKKKVKDKKVKDTDMTQ